jgi:phage baseplate assembly protein V
MRQLWQRVTNMFAHGSVTGVNDSGGVQTHQLRLGYMETRDNTPVIQHFGLASTPPIGSDAVLVFFGGDRSQGLVVGTNNQGVRPVNQGAGETTVYNAHGMTIAIAATGITVNSGGQPITLTNAPNITLNTPHVATTGNLTVATGATGTFSSATGDVITVQDGIITNIY